MGVTWRGQGGMWGGCGNTGGDMGETLGDGRHGGVGEVDTMEGHGGNTGGL